MEISQLLKDLGTCKKNLDSLVKLMKEISRLEEDRMENLPLLKVRLAKLDGNIDQLSQYISQFVVLRNWVDLYRVDLTNSEAELMKRFGVDLEEELRKEGLSLSGQYPDLKSGLFTIELDFDRSRVIIWYGPKQERLDQCRLSVSEVINRVQKLKQQLGSGLEENELVKRFQEAYSRVMAGKCGEPAPIIEVLTELAYLLQTPKFRQDPKRENFRSYCRADFSYDIRRVRQFKDVQLTVATRAHTKRRGSFLWVPDDESGRGTTYSHLHFRETT